MRPGQAGSARRYARALLDVAHAGGEADTVRRELGDAVRTIHSHPELRVVLAHPALAAERKRKVVAAIWSPGRASALTVRLLELLVDRDRIALLPAIENAYAALWNEQRGIVSAEAVSAAPLGPEQEKALAEAIKRATGREVELARSVDPALRGGVLLRMMGRTYDGSVRGRLRALRSRLVQGAERG
jgi:F-type H+-transporting ATPase subunit delta